MTRIEKLLKTMDEHYDEMGEMYDPEKDIRAFLAERDEAIIGNDITAQIGAPADRANVWVDGYNERAETIRLRAGLFDNEEVA